MEALDSLARLLLKLPTALTPERAFMLTWIYNAAVQALPEPAETRGGPFYSWFFNFAHLLAANIALIRKNGKHSTQVVELNREIHRHLSEIDRIRAIAVKHGVDPALVASPAW